MSILKQRRPTSPIEEALFQNWASKNGINLTPYQDYDNYGAFQARLNRDSGEESPTFRDWATRNGVDERRYRGLGGDGEIPHFPDTFKLPFHESFSDESKYYRPGMPAVHWVGEQKTPAVSKDLQQLIIRSLLGRNE